MECPVYLHNYKNIPPFIWKWFNDATPLTNLTFVPAQPMWTTVCYLSIIMLWLWLGWEWKEKALKASKTLNERVHIRRWKMKIHWYPLFQDHVIVNLNGTVDATRIIVCYKAGAKPYKYLLLNSSLINWKQFPKAKVYIWTLFYANIYLYCVEQNQYCLVKLVIAQYWLWSR